jgi:hypothetical protein
LGNIQHRAVPARILSSAVKVFAHRVFHLVRMARTPRGLDRQAQTDFAPSLLVFGFGLDGFDGFVRDL